MKKIQQIIDSLKDEFLLEKEEDMAGFLGLDISLLWMEKQSL